MKVNLLSMSLALIGMSCLTGVVAAHGPKLFFGRETACLVEVEQVGKGKIEIERGVRSTPIVVRVIAFLPPERPMKEHYTITILLPYIRPGIQSGEIQDWFPTQPGNRIVVAFDGSPIPDGSFLCPAVGAGATPALAWQDCTSFYEIVRQTSQKRETALAQFVEKNRKQIGPGFFHLIADYCNSNEPISDGNAFAFAAAKYLEDGQVSLLSRRTIPLGSLRPRRGEANKALASARVKLILEAKDANLHPGIVRNMLMDLLGECVLGRTTADLPELARTVREELLKLALEEEQPFMKRHWIPLVTWLQGKAIAPIPPPSEEELKLNNRVPEPSPHVVKVPTDEPKIAVMPDSDASDNRKSGPAPMSHLSWWLCGNVALVLGLCISCFFFMRYRSRT